MDYEIIKNWANANSGLATLIGILVAIAIPLIGGFFTWLRRKKKSNQEEENKNNSQKKDRKIKTKIYVEHAPNLQNNLEDKKIIEEKLSGEI